MWVVCMTLFAICMACFVRMHVFNILDTEASQSQMRPRHMSDAYSPWLHSPFSHRWPGGKRLAKGHASKTVLASHSCSTRGMSDDGRIPACSLLIHCARWQKLARGGMQDTCWGDRNSLSRRRPCNAAMRCSATTCSADCSTTHSRSGSCERICMYSTAAWSEDE